MCLASVHRSWTSKCHFSYQLPDILILLPPFISLHTSLCIPLTQWQSLSLTVLSIVWMGLNATQCTRNYVFSVYVCVQGMKWLLSNCFWVAVEKVSWTEGHWCWRIEACFYFILFFSVLSQVLFTVLLEKAAVNVCKTVHCVWVWEKRAKKETSDINTLYSVMQGSVSEVFLCLLF